MTDRTLIEWIRIPGSLGVLAGLVYTSYLLIKFMASRFRSEIREYREDIARLRMEKYELIREHDEDQRRCEERVDRLESEMSVMRDKMRADRQQCDEQISRLTVQVVGLRRELARYTPPEGNPSVS